MAELKWGPGLAVGVPEMDEEHQGLIAAMHALQQLDAVRADGPCVEAAFVQLLDLTRSHFAHEEAYMASFGYSGLARHRQIHVELLERLDRFHDDFRGGNGRLPDGLMRFLVYWLSAHIQGIDRKYATEAARVDGPHVKPDRLPVPSGSRS